MIQLTVQIFALIAATFLYVWIAKHGLGRAYRIFAGLIVTGILVMIAITCIHCCCWGRGGGCYSHEGYGSSCMKHDGEGHQSMHGDSATVIEKEVIIKNGDTIVNHTH